MDRHCIKYVTWESVSGWRRRVLAEGRSVEASYPFSFGSRDPAMLGLTSDVLWLVTLPRYGRYRQAPSIVARLEIVDTGRDDGSERFSALPPEVRESGPYIVFARRDPDAYLPLNNAFDILRSLELRGRTTEIPDVRALSGPGGPYSTLARYLQRHRWVAESSVPALERYAEAVRRGRRVFLSYKRSDFPLAADASSWPERLATELSSRHISCWWDRWYLPQAGQSELTEDLLGDLLDDAVRQAVWFVALVGPDLAAAADDSWPRREWARAGAEVGRGARRHPMSLVVVLFGGPDPAGWACDHVIEVGSQPDPAAVAALLDDVISAG